MPLQAAPLQTASRRDSALEGSRLRLQEAFRTPPGAARQRPSKQRPAKIGPGGRHLLALTSPPTAIIAMNNLLVLGALNAVREKGLQIPRNISIIGWDDFDAASHFRMPLTVVDQPASAMGTMAAEHLLQLVSGETSDQPLEILLRCSLIIRESCSALDAAKNSAITNDGANSASNADQITEIRHL